MANLEEILQTGGAVILPTETVYGLFAQAMNEEAVGPSANISGQESGKVFAQIQKQFDNSVEGFADDSSITGVDSTILDLSGEFARILRQGAITKEDLLAQIPELTFAKD